MDTISKDNDKIYEAEMEMQLPEMRRISLDDMTFSRMTFHINAKASEERITFSGDEIHSLGETKYTVEGYMKQGLSYEQDTLLVQVKRISPRQVSQATPTNRLLMKTHSVILIFRTMAI